jgi:hypothetical protein
MIVVGIVMDLPRNVATQAPLQNPETRKTRIIYFVKENYSVPIKKPKNALKLCTGTYSCPPPFQALIGQPCYNYRNSRYLIRETVAGAIGENKHLQASVYIREN